VYLNGKPLVEPYVVHSSNFLESYRDNFPGEPTGQVLPEGVTMLQQNVVDGELVVPPGHYFALGDNRDNSLDSRYWGLVPRENIIGKPLLIYWSYDAPTEALLNPSIGLDHMLDISTHFFAKTRWSRMFHLIHGYNLGSNLN
jgi:signal peptidase I